MALHELYNDPDFRRRSNAVADSSLKVIVSGVTVGLMALYNFVKSMVMMAFGK